MSTDLQLSGKDLERDMILNQNPPSPESLLEAKVASTRSLKRNDTNEEEEGIEYSSTFWGSADQGLEVLKLHAQRNKSILLELLFTLKTRAGIEEAYGKRILKLFKTNLPKEDTPALNNALTVFIDETRASAKLHLEIAKKIKQKLCKPLSDLILLQNIVGKNQVSIVGVELKRKQALMKDVQKLRDKVLKRNRELDDLKIQVETVTEDRKREKLCSKIEKMNQVIEGIKKRFSVKTKELLLCHKKWSELHVKLCEEFQRLDKERYHFIKGCLWNYSNLFSTLCVSTDQCKEHIRATLSTCHFAADSKSFVENNLTGYTIPALPKYVIECDIFMDADKQNDFMNSTKAMSGQQFLSKMPLTSLEVRSVKSSIIDLSCPSNKGVHLTSSNPSIQSNSEHKAEQCNTSSKSLNVTECTGVRARVLYKFSAKALDEISLYEGEIVTNIEFPDENWAYGSVERTGVVLQGLFPSGYVEVISNEITD